ncbi:MAG TPA: hypothetical protein EYP41_10950 [Anaerolineae bacterium]|nr:hypothetical protein [Anaerolineae bacterium]HIP72192.1 hypothetical protein [Anaerolineae bacterium]
MIDSIIVSPIVHMITGSLVLLTSLIAAFLIGRRAWKQQPISKSGRIAFIAAQLALILQLLVGVKLLDQGFGNFQLYIHYIGGMAPLAFFLLYYWKPLQDQLKQTWAATAVTTLAFVFAFMTFVIGSMYVPG